MNPCSSSADPVADLRRMSSEQLARVAEDGLREHLLDRAVLAHRKHGPLGPGNLDAFLRDPDLVRYPVRLVYEFGEMAMHQFAQPDLDPRNPEEQGRVIYLRPMLRGNPELAALAVAYMLPVANYGEDVVTDEHCLLYGATLMGMTTEVFYQRICDLADRVGSEPRLRAA